MVCFVFQFISLKTPTLLCGLILRLTLKYCHWTQTFQVNVRMDCVLHAKIALETPVVLEATRGHYQDSGRPMKLARE